MGFTVDTKAITAEKMGYTNKMALLEAVRRFPGSSRLSLAQTVGLDPSTVSKIVTALIELGLVKELGARDTGTPGRRSIMLSVVPEAVVVLVVSIGVERTKIALGKLDCSVEQIEEIPTRKDARAFFDELAKVVERVISHEGNGRVRDLVVSVPGMLDTASNVLYEAPNIGWVNIDIRDELARRIPSFDLPTQTWNDANLAMIAETFVNPLLLDMNYGLCLHLSHSIGGAVWSGGKINVGAHNIAGEIGHSTIDRNGPVCRCGRRGCLNVFASVEKVAANFDREADSPLEGDTYFEKMDDLFARMEKGDKHAGNVLTKAAGHVGEGVANMLNSFDPDFVVITGLGSFFTQSLLGKVTEEVRKRALDPLARDMTILSGSLSPETSTLIGATLVGIESLLVSDLKNNHPSTRLVSEPGGCRMVSSPTAAGGA